MDRPNTDAYLPQNFTLIIDNLRDVTYNCQSVTFPGVSGGVATTPTPFQNLNFSGTSYNHEPLSANIILNEDLTSFTSLVKWIKNRTISNSFGDYVKQQDGDIGITSSATLQFYTSANRRFKAATFTDLFPVSVGGFTVSTEVTGTVPVIVFPVVFEYQTCELD